MRRTNGSTEQINYATHSYEDNVSKRSVDSSIQGSPLDVKRLKIARV